ncbi:unnamed protein product [Arctia plantaginis]|uniref:Protein phosphatase 1 regulatory subunit 36 n=1 Tax=Arctia plantaginis TaxID=874455 RepID=A0A8S0ZS61_ARCPL|nr:unnamed protein product [Arctia plantaginis]
MSEDDEEGFFGGLYEDGHWVWDEVTAALIFVSDRPPVPVQTKKATTKVATGVIVFRDDLDLIEQFRYRRRYQRKLEPGQLDVITLQDVIDLAIYTAPVQILSPILINMLHLPTMERFLRALILCSAYYLQVSDEMTFRTLDLEAKVRTPYSEIVEYEFQENLSDLRILVGKEYCVMLIGGADTKNYHHMGPAKKRKSLSDKDARLFETLLRMCVQIVWLALGRKSFHLVVEHTMKTGYITKMTPEERAVLLGCCVKNYKKLNSRSPLSNEVFCFREIDYRMMGLGVVQPHEKTRRQQYLWHLIAGKEENLAKIDATLDVKSKATVSSRGNTIDTTKSTITKTELYPPIIIPTKSSRDTGIPLYFPDETEPPRRINNVQRLRWQNRLMKLLESSKTSVRKEVF